MNFLTEIDNLTLQIQKLKSEVEFWKIKYNSLEKSHTLHLQQSLSAKPELYLVIFFFPQNTKN